MPSRGRRLDMPARCTYNAGRPREPQTQYTLRGIPKELDDALRRKSREEGLSLNQTAVKVLFRGLGPTDDAPVYHDLDHLIGTWVKDPAFDEAMREMETVDPDLWR